MITIHNTQLTSTQHQNYISYRKSGATREAALKAALSS